MENEKTFVCKSSKEFSGKLQQEQKAVNAESAARQFIKFQVERSAQKFVTGTQFTAYVHPQNDPDAVEQFCVTLNYEYACAKV